MPASDSRVPETAAARRRSSPWRTASSRVASGTSARIGLLPEAGVDAHEPVVGEAESPAEDERAVQERSAQSAAPRQWEPEQDQDHTEDARGEQEAKTRAPERVELPVADAHTDGIPSREHGSDGEGGKRRAVPAHGRVSSETVSTCGVWGNMSTGRTRRSSYPYSPRSTLRSEASVVGLQET